MRDHFVAANSFKANFDEIYGMEDPRGYFSVLGALDYMIPDLAEPVVRQLLEARAERYAGEPLVLDVGCSYGINAAVHRFPVSFNVLRRRYTRRAIAKLAPEELLRLDRHYFSSWPDVGVARFVGLDSSVSALRYAERVGLIERGIAADLETRAPTSAERSVLADVDVILSTGAVGYITEKTFGALLESLPKRPWVISFVLRMFPFDRLAALFSAAGLVTERLSSTMFVQRRFQSAAELESTLDALARLGIETRGFEADGLLRAELFVSRPPADVAAAPLHEIVTVSSGRQRAVGARFVQVDAAEPQVALQP